MIEELYEEIHAGLTEFAEYNNIKIEHDLEEIEKIIDNSIDIK